MWGVIHLERFLICQQIWRITVSSCFVFTAVHAKIPGLCFRTSYVMLVEDKFLTTVPSVLKQFLIVLLDILIKTGVPDTGISLCLIVYINDLQMFKSKVLSIHGVFQ